MDTASKKAMAKDTVFRLASMTKPVVGAAIMMMLEEGKLTLSDPVYKFIPEFKGIKVGVLQTAGRDGKPHVHHCSSLRPRCDDESSARCARTPTHRVEPDSAGS